MNHARLAAAFLLALATRADADLVIDDFRSIAESIHADSGTVTMPPGDLPGELGGRRTLQLAVPGGPARGYALAAIDAHGSGQLSLACEESAAGAATLRYSLAGPMGPGRIDLGAYGRMFLVAVNEVEAPGPATIAIAVCTPVGRRSVAREVAGPGTLLIDFAEFAGLDFAEVQKIEMEVSLPGPGSVAIGAIGVIAPGGDGPLPIPATLAMVGAAGAVLAGWARAARRRAGMVAIPGEPKPAPDDAPRVVGACRGSSPPPP